MTTDREKKRKVDMTEGREKETDGKKNKKKEKLQESDTEREINKKSKGELKRSLK